MSTPSIPSTPVQNPPPINTPFFDPQTKQMANAWVMYFIRLSGGVQGASTDDVTTAFATSQQGGDPTGEALAALEAVGQGMDLSERLQSLEVAQAMAAMPIVTGTSGQATVPFASMLSEDSITVTGVSGVRDTSAIVAQVYADNDDVYAQDWVAPVVRNIVAGVGFDLVLRPLFGLFAGPVKVNWSIA